MSGGVRPTYDDITLPREEEVEEEERTHLHHETSTGKTSSAAAGGLLSFHQLNSLAIIVVLSTSGLVCVDDLAFVLFSLVYFIFLSRSVFPPKTPKIDGPLTSPSNKTFRLYVAAAGIVGLVIPICYICHGVFEDDKVGIRAAAPHVFLLASQVFMEGVASRRGFSAPMRILIPIFYNARRILTIVEWLRGEFTKETPEFGTISRRRMLAGRALATANMAVWSFNLFGVLLPVYLPRAFKRYYEVNNKDD
ncbi:PREDICTED: uncharacterized protein LOC109115968 [Tarenaya hassleriana]|uniref:uncharacterized protein LOC109115968 n=1 Tax=Tarenaya hassleriana TaxID=28532 RepID=UPI00053C2B16|nr:PREDICTED: uncharacterized protein LOC109115968 [Tarenaya hassleriana]